MRFPFKRLLILLMMLVLPVQTFASAAMLGCAFSHQGPGTADAMAQAASAEALPACHTPEQPDATPAKHDCNHCAACYLASALPIPSIYIPPIAPVSHSVIVHKAVALHGFIPDSPDRPPRS